MYGFLQKSLAELQESKSTEIRLMRNPVVAANNKHMPKIYGYRRRSRNQTKSRVYDHRMQAQNTSILSEEILEVVKMQVSPTNRSGVPKAVLSTKCFTLEELADRVHTPKHKPSSRADSPINRLRLHSTEPPAVAIKEPPRRPAHTKAHPHHIVLDRLRQISPLPHENETEHKVVRRYITSVSLPHITSEAEATQTSQQQLEKESSQPSKSNSEAVQTQVVQRRSQRKHNWSERSRKIRKSEHSFFIEEETESDGSSAAEPSPSRLKRTISMGQAARFEKKITILDPRETREAGTGMEKVSIEVNEFAGNTLFYIKAKEEQFEKLKMSRTRSLLASQASSIRMKVPSKEEMSEFLQSYQPMDVGFDIKALLNSEKFRVAAKKGYIYSGETEDNKPNGMGLLFSQKSRFEGQFIKGQKLRGTEVTAEGTYCGSFQNGMRHGQGEFIWKNKETYKGEWKNNMKNGQGLWTCPNGDHFKGTWLNNEPYQGQHFHKGISCEIISGNLYKGTFKNFKKHGRGEQDLGNGDHYIGDYIDGKPNGSGDYTWADGSKYTGEFQEGMRHGLGVLQRDGNLYRGLFKYDFKEGEGQIFYRDGSSFRGRFHQDRPTAEGEYKCADGSPALYDLAG